MVISTDGQAHAVKSECLQLQPGVYRSRTSLGLGRIEAERKRFLSLTPELMYAHVGQPNWGKSASRVTPPVWSVHKVPTSR